MFYTPADVWSPWLAWGRQSGAGLGGVCVFPWLTFVTDLLYTRGWECQVMKWEHPPSPEWSPEPPFLNMPSLSLHEIRGWGVQPKPLATFHGQIIWGHTLEQSCCHIAGYAHLPSKPSPAGTFDLCHPFPSLSSDSAVKLLDLTNRNTGCPVKFESQRTNRWLFT